MQWIVQVTEELMQETWKKWQLPWYNKYSQSIADLSSDGVTSRSLTVSDIAIIAVDDIDSAY